MAKPDEFTETETHHNQALTDGASKRITSASREQAAKPKKKVVVLQLDPKETAALKHLGGVESLKKLLCPQDLCIRCRENSSANASWYCAGCGNA